MENSKAIRATMANNISIGTKVSTPDIEPST